MISTSVPGLTTDSPGGVWWHGWTTSCLYGGPLCCPGFIVKKSAMNPTLQGFLAYRVWLLDIHIMVSIQEDSKSCIRKVIEINNATKTAYFGCYHCHQHGTATALTVFFNKCYRYLNHLRWEDVEIYIFDDHTSKFVGFIFRILTWNAKLSYDPNFVENMHRACSQLWPHSSLWRRIEWVAQDCWMYLFLIQLLRQHV